MVDLKAKPFYLNDEDIKWVKDTISEMSLEEKIGQLFITRIHGDLADPDNAEIVKKYHVGGIRYASKRSEEVYNFIKDMQAASKIPLLAAANCDNGGDGASTNGTFIASGAMTEASESEEVAYNAGLVSGREEAALGVNWNFDPSVDILYNWRNTIVNTRAYGNTPEKVIKYTSAYLEGLKDSEVGEIATCVKHFPGDGVEERDQHLVLGINDFEPKKWDQTFGKVYKHHIDNGLMSIMAGHIAMPEYSKQLNPELSEQDIMPATLASELLNDLLRDKLGFNGLVVTDASHMLGMTAAMSRKDYVPGAIAAGCDMFLFFNDKEEDFQFMLEGYKNGVITDQRLNEALERILGLKAAINLHQNSEADQLVPAEDKLEIIGQKEHHEMAAEAADQGITLVKDSLDQLPITPETHPRIKLYYLYGELGGIYNSDTSSRERIIEELEKAGFEVDLNEGESREKGKIMEYRDKYDAAFVFADVRGYAQQNNYRIKWKSPMDNEVPWYAAEIPTVFVSLNYTNHFIDVPMVKTFINAHGNTSEIIRQTIEKIMGKSDFKGSYNENVWCDIWEAKR
ncbi:MULTISPECIES: glycoside hydrolase family 3 protein [Halanaerobium]|uniref:beta-N-acetylhexosaminidase n=1 Tax=Halanaerobium kushneri TaxID=56779 RepID=A0A1N6R391_9FIRM|nr:MULTISPECIES: glycoside hydrolase family 3 N-terminal domain-containing protein [Halanaerobium]RCW61094.1 beta-N-acetylhexosaminidase [Halanaerobium sp. ST460_2HS_T2]SIQ23308.1 beta-N-acetylhexosaminidase [Halanaerobium kushneri]